MHAGGPTSHAPDAPLPRVAYVAGLDPSQKFGSLEEQALLLGRAFRERGSCFVPVFTRPLCAEAARAYRDAGVDAEALDLWRFRPGSLRALLTRLRRHRIDLVHWSFYAPFNPYLWALSALRPGLRHFFTDHNSRWFGERDRSPKPVRRALKNLLFARHERIVCVSGFVADALRHEGVRTELTPCAHFVNTDRFRPDPAARERVRRALGAEERFVVVLVGRLIREKGPELLLRAAARLPGEIVVWMIGDGAESAPLQALAETLGLEGRVLFLGDRGNVEPFLQAADCLACPSQWEEAAGLVNIEALACGLPVVATRVGGIPEIVDDGHTGLLVPAGTVDGLAEAIHRLFKEPERRAALGRKARAVAVERFSPESRLPAYLDLYRAWEEGSPCPSTS